MMLRVYSRSRYRLPIDDVFPISSSPPARSPALPRRSRPSLGIPRPAAPAVLLPKLAELATTPFPIPRPSAIRLLPDHVNIPGGRFKLYVTNEIHGRHYLTPVYFIWSCFLSDWSCLNDWLGLGMVAKLAC